MYLALGGVTLAHPGDQPAIAKGDSIYVAAQFKEIDSPKPIGGAHVTYDMPACKALILKKVDPAKLIWTVEDPLGNAQQLQGAWTPFMFMSETDCLDYVKAHGEAQVAKSGKTFKVK
jgi:hypothetical protein